MFFFDLTTFLTAHLLRSTNEDFLRILQELQSHFKGIEFNHPRAPHTQAIAARDSSGAYIGFVPWITSLKQDEAVLFPALPAPDPAGGYHAPVSAIYQSQSLLWLSRHGNLNLFALTRESSSDLMITGAELESLIDSQVRPGIKSEEVWQEIIQGVVVYAQKFQDKDKITFEEARHHIRHERIELLHGEQRIVELLEDFLWKRGQELLIPHDLTPKLISKQTPPRRFNTIQSPKLLQPLTGAEMLALMDEQKNPQIIESFRDVLKQLSQLKPTISDTFNAAVEKSTDLRELLPKISQTQADQIPSEMFLDLLGEEFKVPPTLDHKFKPAYPPDTRLQRRWILQFNLNPWDVYYFKPVAPDESVLPAEAVSLLSTSSRQKFETTLERIVSENTAVDREFGTFLSALRVLKNLTLDFSSAAEFKRTARIAGLSETALERLDNSLVFSLKRIFKLPDDKVRALLATEICNIFHGGMGSWNDGPSSSDRTSISDLPPILTELKIVLNFAIG